MTRILDKSRPFGTIYGEMPDGSVFEQDGCRFNGQGECVFEPSKAAAPAAPPAAESPPAEKPPEPSMDMRAKLEALHVSKVKQLVVDAGLTPASGPGAKARNIDLLLEAEG